MKTKSQTPRIQLNPPKLKLSEIDQMITDHRVQLDLLKELRDNKMKSKRNRLSSRFIGKFYKDKRSFTDSSFHSEYFIPQRYKGGGLYGLKLFTWTDNKKEVLTSVEIDSRIHFHFDSTEPKLLNFDGDEAVEITRDEFDSKLLLLTESLQKYLYVTRDSI